MGLFGFVAFTRFIEFVGLCTLARLWNLAPAIAAAVHETMALIILYKKTKRKRTGVVALARNFRDNLDRPSGIA